MCDIGFVYKWYDTSNDKWYIGSHTGHPKDGYIGGGHFFKKAYKKRKKSFSREILYFGHDHRELEEFILEELDAMNNPLSYNLTNNWKGVTRHTEETKNKISESRKGITVSVETRKKLSKAKKGERHPAYGKEGYTKGRKHTDESKRKMSISQSTKIYCEHNNKIYLCSKDAANDLNCSISHIGNMIRGQKTNKYGLKRL
jgi:hypothetical protein